MIGGWNTVVVRIGLVLALGGMWTMEAGAAVGNGATVPFVANRGQWSDEVAFGTRTFAGMLYVTEAGTIVHEFPAPPASSHPARAWSLVESFVDGSDRRRRVVARGIEPQPTQVSYYLTSATAARHVDGTHARLDLGRVFDGVDVQLRAAGANVEKIFTVAPGANPLAIRVRIDGATRLRIGARGELVADTDNGPISFTAPVAYQEAGDGSRVAVPVRYRLDRRNSRYGFTVGDYDHRRPLVIDPLLQSTYVGGGQDDEILAMAIHPLSGDVYVGGYFQGSGTDYPGVALNGGGYQPSTVGPFAGIISRFSADLRTLKQSTFLGSGTDFVRGLAIDAASGDVYVVGTTNSAGSSFPGVTLNGGGAQVSFAGGQQDVFVSRFSADLKTLRQSTYFGGDALDMPTAVAINPLTGHVYVAGYTFSTTGPMVNAGGFQTSNAGGSDGFIARFGADLRTVQATFFGTGTSDTIDGLAIHPQTGEVYVCGQTFAAGSTFPGVLYNGGGAQTVLNGTSDVFVSRFTADLKTLRQSTLLGGDGDEDGMAIQIHPATGEVYVGGRTNSSGITFAGAIKNGGGAQIVAQGSYDAFVSRFDLQLTALLQSTYLGSTNADSFTGMKIHPVTGDVYVVGVTSATSPAFPAVSGGVAAANAGSQDGFVSRLNGKLTLLLQSSYIGGTGYETIRGLEIHPQTGLVYVDGTTNTSGTAYPGVLLNGGGAQTTFGGANDGIISLYTPDLAAADVVPDPFSFPSALGVPIGSTQTAFAQINGIGAATTMSVRNGNFAQACVSNTSACACDVVAYTNGSASVTNGKYVCVQQAAPPSAPALAKATVVVGGTSADFIVTTGAQLAGANCSLDVDGNNATDALTDGMLLMRAMFGLTGTAVTGGAVGANATRSDWAAIRAYLNGNCGTNFAP